MPTAGACAQGLHEQMDDEQIDLWICPAAMGEAPSGIEATGDPNMNLPWTHAGMPAMTIPAGRGEGRIAIGNAARRPFRRR